MHYHDEDTITALATAPGTGAISVIRISGSKSFEAVDQIFSGRQKLADAQTHTIHYGKIMDRNNEVIDDVLVSVFRNPNSYTGEDSAEISTHGSSYIVEKIISALVERGVRLAEPGEFSKRAFLNSKLDLAQAEAVADVINSRTEASLRGARNQLDGILSSKVKSLRNMLIEISSLTELELDFVEENIELMPLDEIYNKVTIIEDEIESLLQTYSFGRVIKDGVNVALVGKTNVGKSSLLNYLLKEARAIVSEIPGTTRDIIREELYIDGILFKLYDTAGIRNTEDEIEREGVLRSKDAVKNADVVLFMNDIKEKFAEDLYGHLKELTSEDKIVKIGNKVDLKSTILYKYDVRISSLTGEGIGELFSVLKRKAVGSFNYTEKSAIVSNLRHYNALQKASEHLKNAKKSISERYSNEFIAVDLRNAENSLGEIVGEITSDDILNNIFAKFCIGK
jgi:tRNA modification GTPase